MKRFSLFKKVYETWKVNQKDEENQLVYMEIKNAVSTSTLEITWLEIHVRIESCNFNSTDKQFLPCMSLMETTRH
ncbi:conserved hypothetical protein [Ricinus communis]|uniref:Uncharacterized protein n=1 Tax=Ricinus communis TaxID=3988 RepID=B9S9M6_RICCO|nr:conserved hypothetical protein [Ricinus communis]